MEGNQKKLLPSWTPHGKALLAFWKGKLDCSLGITIEGESTDWMPIDTYFRTIEEMPELEAYALSLCTGNTLDVGAGAGAHSLLLQGEGKKVVALDIAPEAIEIMKARGIKQTICSDFLSLQTPQLFDTLLFLMNGIGIAGNLEGLKKYLIHANELTKPNGQILLDSSDLRKTDTKLSAKESYFGIINYQLSFEKQKGEPYQWLYIDPDLLNQTASNTGWYCQIIFENEDGSYLARLIKK